MTGLLFLLLLIPVVMAGSGWWLQRKATRINLICGYRTTMSTRNDDTWKFAQEHCGRLWFRVGLAMLTVSVPMMVVALAQELEAGMYIALGVLTVQMVALLVCCVPTELALRKTFDRTGKRIAE